MVRWQMLSNNGGWLKQATVELSTVEMPHIKGLDLGYRYESCVFTKGSSSEVVDRYDNVVEAIAGHQRWCRKLGLKA
jgi:hypothetical protein